MVAASHATPPSAALTLKSPPQHVPYDGPSQTPARRQKFIDAGLRPLPEKWSRRLELCDKQYYHNVRPVWYWTTRDGREVAIQGNLWEISLRSWLMPYSMKNNNPELTYWNTKPWLKRTITGDSGGARGYDQRLHRDDRRFSIPYDLQIYKEEMFRLQPLLSSSEINRFFWHKYPFESAVHRPRYMKLQHELAQRSAALPNNLDDNPHRKPVENKLV